MRFGEQNSIIAECATHLRVGGVGKAVEDEKRLPDERAVYCSVC